MRPTRPSTVVALLLVGAGVGFLLQGALASAALPKFVPTYPVAISLVVIAAVVIALAVPIRRATRATVRTRIDPFHATRVVVLSKASSLAGALLTGAALGLLLELFVRSSGLNADPLLKTLAVLGGAVALLVAGLVGEFLCTVPPTDDDPELHPDSLEP